jgi:hypothetical protein
MKSIIFESSSLNLRSRLFSSSVGSFTFLLMVIPDRLVEDGRFLKFEGTSVRTVGWAIITGFSLEGASRGASTSVNKAGLSVTMLLGDILLKGASRGASTLARDVVTEGFGM